MYYLDAQGAAITSLVPVEFVNDRGAPVSLAAYALPTADRLALGIWSMESDELPDPAAFLVTGETYEKLDSVVRRHWTSRPLTPQEIADAANPTLPQDQLLAYAANKRWEIETGGITVGGVQIATDDRSKALINGTKAYLDANQTLTIKFKAGEGWVELGQEQITGIFTAVAAHVQSCFTAEAAIDARIGSGELTTAAAIDAAFAAALQPPAEG